MLESVLEPCTIRGITISNRFVMTAMHNNLSHGNEMTEAYLNYYEERAKGGWGLITTEIMSVMEGGGSSFKDALSLEKDDDIPMHQVLTSLVHQYDSKIVAQLYHGGMVAKRSITGKAPKAPSPIKDIVMPETAQALTITEIENIVEKFGDAAVRAQKAGYDGVELHGANRYLIFSFVSPLTNKRTDAYGGNIIRRAKFPVDIVKNIRKKVGENFLIVYKMSTMEFVNGGQKINESKILAKLLESAGVDIICCAQGGSKSRHMYIPSYHIPKGNFIDNTAAIKASVKIPVMANSRIVDPEMAELFIKEGKTDFVAMGRESLADPAMPRKVVEGKLDEVFRCIGCHQGCIGELDRLRPLRCLLNPRTGQEFMQLEQVHDNKEVWVIGGGIGGCEAAIWAAKRGCKVVLWEKNSMLGGQWRAACVPIGKADFAEVLYRQKLLLEKYKVKVKLNTEVFVDQIKQAMPAGLIVATGGRPIRPSIDGLDSIKWAFAKDILLGKEEIVNNVVELKDKVVHAATAKGTNHIVIVGGGLVGIETAEYLQLHGNKVTLLELKEEVALESASVPRKFLMDNIKKVNIDIRTSACVTKVMGDQVIYVQDGEEKIIKAVDMIILAVGVERDKSLEESLKGYQGKVLVLGKERTITDGYSAMQEGYRVGMII